jgi:hypothetical protein
MRQRHTMLAGRLHALGTDRPDAPLGVELAPGRIQGLGRPRRCQDQELEGSGADLLPLA